MQDDFEEFETPDDIYEPILDQLENVADTSVRNARLILSSHLPYCRMSAAMCLSLTMRVHCVLNCCPPN